MATQTYTPSASAWNSTSRYQENGDTTDATIGAAETGEDALDNLAYLTGGNTESAVRRIATVADLAALKALTSQRDRDYFVLDSNKRLYQFDSGSSATGDDYAVVQPSAGSGRYVLVASAVPKITALRRVKYAQNGTIRNSGSAPSGTSVANGYFRNDATGNTSTIDLEFDDLQNGDEITELQLVGDPGVGGTGQDITAAWYLYQSDDGDTAPTVTSLGTLTLSAGGAAGEASKTSSPLPFIIPESPAFDKLVCRITSAGDATNYAQVNWVAVNGTRSYIRE